MSKFFSKGGSSDSESEEEETSSEEESSEDEKPVKKAGPARTEEIVRKGPRKVVSQKDKRYDEMRLTVKQLKNAIKINDWNAISNGVWGVCNCIIVGGVLKCLTLQSSKNSTSRSAKRRS
jgi:hypothetical protein